MVAATAGDCAAALAQVLKLGKALDERQREKEEDAEAGEPGRYGHSGCRRAGQDADSVKPREDDDIDHHGPLESERVRQRGDGIDRQPLKKMIGASERKFW